EGGRDAALARRRSGRRDGQRQILREERAAEAPRPGRRSLPTRTRDAGGGGAARGGADQGNKRPWPARTSDQHLTESAGFQAMSPQGCSRRAMSIYRVTQCDREPSRPAWASAVRVGHSASCSGRDSRLTPPLLSSSAEARNLAEFTSTH